MKELHWTVVEEKVVFSHPLFSFRESTQQAADGTQASFLLLDCPDWVNVVAMTKNQDGEPCVLLVQQHRFGSASQSLEFPGGVVDPGETVLQAAQRELREETGFEAGRWLELGSVNPNAAFMTNRTHGYLAQDLVKVGELDLDGTERLVPHLITLAELEQGLHPSFSTNGIMLITWHWFQGWKQRSQGH